MNSEIQSDIEVSNSTTPLIPNQVFLGSGNKLVQEEGFGHLDLESEEEIELEVATDSISKEIPRIFIFINPKAGSREGEKLLNMHIDRMRMRLDNGESVEVLFYDIMDEISRLRGMSAVKLYSKSSKVRVISAGGDGTPAWVIQEMIRVGVCLSSVYLIVLPFGTVNVLSRNLGWHKAVSTYQMANSMLGFREVVKVMMEGEAVKYDVWNVEIQVESTGFIEIQRKFKKGTTRVHLTDKQGCDLKKVRRFMVSFFSIGLDGRIGFQFDKHRTRNRSCNVFCYLLSGFENICCSRNPPITSFTSQFSTYESGNKQIIYDSHKDFVRQDAVVFMAINQHTFGPNYHIWDRAANWEALMNPDWQPQSTFDGLLEWLAVPSLGLQLEIVKAIGIDALRMHQGRGPFHINFSNEELSSTLYMEIDGEYLSVYRPKEVILSLSHECTDLNFLQHNV
jgi:diacylglycerol kinase family enzyme